MTRSHYKLKTTPESFSQNLWNNNTPKTFYTIDLITLERRKTYIGSEELLS